MLASYTRTPAMRMASVLSSCRAIPLIGAVRFISKPNGKGTDGLELSNQLKSLPKKQSKEEPTATTTPKEEEVEIEVVNVQGRNKRKPLRASTTTTTATSKDKSNKKNFIPFSQFPQMPDDIRNESEESLFKRFGIQVPFTSSSIISTPKPDKFIDFEIPQEHLKPKPVNVISQKDKRMVEEIDKMVNLNLPETDTQLLSMRYTMASIGEDGMMTPTHPLKKSISGMMPLNRDLDKIKDDYLWNVIPKNKLFGVPPYEQEPFTFKKWEQEMLAKQQESQKKLEALDQEIKEFEKQLGPNKSFYRNVGSRRRFDRKLYKDYKMLTDKRDRMVYEYEQEQKKKKQKQQQGLLDEDEEVEFEIIYE